MRIFLLWFTVRVYASEPESVTMGQVYAEVQLLLESPSLSQIEPKLWNILEENVSHVVLPPSSTVDTEGYFHLERIFRQQTTGVYEIVSDPPSNIVLVYRQFCERPGRSIDMIGIDYWFLRHLRGTGLVPEVYDLSAALSRKSVFHILHNAQDGKTHVTLCSDPSVIPQVRYIVMEKIIGGSIVDELDRRSQRLSGTSIHNAMGYGIGMIETIKSLHDLNVIHGDAHGGNFMIGNTPLMQMIDFERARIFDPNEYEPSQSCDSPEVWSKFRINQFTISTWTSVWEARKCIPSFRDDVHRIMIQLAALIYGDAYWRFFEWLSLGYRDPATGAVDRAATTVLWNSWLHYRSQGMIFNISGLQQSIIQQGLSRVLQSTHPETEFLLAKKLKMGLPTIRIYGLFHQLEQLVMRLSLSERPAYDRIISTMREIERLVGR